MVLLVDRHSYDRQLRHLTPEPLGAILGVIFTPTKCRKCRMSVVLARRYYIQAICYHALVAGNPVTERRLASSV